MSHENENYDPKEWGGEPEAGSRYFPTDFAQGPGVCAENVIHQEYAGTIEVDGRESDIVQIWLHIKRPNKKKDGVELIQVERENLLRLIHILTNHL
jgi:hypothetical protein